MTTTTNIFLAGATGAVGRALIPRLLERGHTVTGTTRSPEKADALRALGVVPVIVDGLDRGPRCAGPGQESNESHDHASFTAVHPTPSRDSQSSPSQ